MPRFVDATGSSPAMISPDTRPLPRRAAVYSIASKNDFCPIVFSLPGQSSANTFGSSNS